MARRMESRPEIWLEAAKKREGGEVMKNKPQVGQRLFSLNIRSDARHTPQVLTPVVVVKVGMKYFSTAPDMESPQWSQTQYSIEDWSEKTDCVADSRLYETVQEWEDEKECSEISAFINSKSLIRLGLEKLRKIKQIIDQP